MKKSGTYDHEYCYGGENGVEKDDGHLQGWNESNSEWIKRRHETYQRSRSFECGDDTSKDLNNNNGLNIVDKKLKFEIKIDVYKAPIAEYDKDDYDDISNDKEFEVGYLDNKKDEINENNGNMPCNMGIGIDHKPLNYYQEADEEINFEALRIFELSKKSGDEADDLKDDKKKEANGDDKLDNLEETSQVGHCDENEKSVKTINSEKTSRVSHCDENKKEKGRYETYQDSTSDIKSNDNTDANTSDNEANKNKTYYNDESNGDNDNKTTIVEENGIMNNIERILTSKKIDHACEIWMKKADKFKNMVSKLNRVGLETDKYGAFSYYQESADLNHACNSWTKRIEEFKRMIKNDSENANNGIDNKRKSNKFGNQRKWSCSTNIVVTIMTKLKVKNFKNLSKFVEQIIKKGKSGMFEDGISNEMTIKDRRKVFEQYLNPAE
ncbi:10675_t:CDS:10, partial [Dentiscutata erythropus]